MLAALLSNYLGSFIRHGLTLVAGLLVAHGVDESATAGFVTSNTDVLLGILSYAIGQGASLFNKKDK